MPYVPSTVLTSSAIADNAGGTVSRTIDAAHATLWNEAAEEKERSSMADAVNALRALIVQGVGKRGGGYRPVTPPAKLVCSLTATGAAVPATLGVYDRNNEDEYRANIVHEGINKLIDDLTAAKGLTGPRGSFTRLVDNSGGTVGSSVGAAGSTYNGGADNNIRATLAAKINAIADAMGV